MRTVCTVTGCQAAERAKGLCNKHYLRVWSHGSTESRSVSGRLRDAGITTCSEQGCERQIKTKGMCYNHYVRRWWSQRGAVTSWISMMERCYRPTNGSYRNYGARGVIVCARWHEVENFLADMGKRPEGTSIDRIDPYGDYTPENCRWASQSQQQHNKRGTRLNWTSVREIRKLWVTGEFTQTKLARWFGVSHGVIWAVVTGRTWLSRHEV